jgi:hypothetical protein
VTTSGSAPFGESLNSPVSGYLGLKTSVIPSFVGAAPLYRTADFKKTTESLRVLVSVDSHNPRKTSKNMFNNFLGGLYITNDSGGGGEALPTGENRVTLDEVEATAEFENQLGPPPAGLVTQTQGEAPTAGYIPPPPPGVGGGMNPPPPPRQQAGMRGGQQPTGESAYSGIDSVIQKLGGKMYDPASIQAELAVQLRGTGTPGDLANRTSFREFVVNVQEFRVYLAMLGNQTRPPGHPKYAC